MNIQRYKWPVIVAAGLHGALFLATPDQSIARGKMKSVEPDLPPIPKEVLMMEDLTEPCDESVASSGGPSVPVIPEIPVELTDRPDFPQPKMENPDPVTTLKEIPNVIGPGKEWGPIGPGIGKIDDAVNLDRHPRVTAQISPEYPLPLHQQGISGSVTVQFDVDTQGHVIRAEIVNCTRREFAEPALRAVRNWRFEPGKRHGKVVPFRMTVPIQFTIDS